MRALSGPCTRRRKKRSPDIPIRGNDVYTQILERVGGVGRVWQEEEEEVELQLKEGWQ